jgi:chromosomal replication initiator protein
MKTWETFLQSLEQELGVETVKKWLRSLKISRFDACNLYLEAKDSFQALWFEEHIRPRVVSSLVNNNNKKIRVHVSIGNRPSGKPKAKSPLKRAGVISQAFQLHFDELDPLLTFEHFVVGEPNQITFRILKEEYGSFNPIYLYGDSGSGKTHLLMAVADFQQKQNKKVIYTRAETFTNHVVSAIRSGEMGYFRQAYRNCDLLILDDVHLFGRKGATQEELFHTFNTLHLMGKQILLASKCPPRELQDVEPRLVSRFEWGIVLPLACAKEKEIESVLMKKAQALDYPFSSKVAEFIIASFTSSPKAAIRALEALILRSHMQQNDTIIFRPMTVQLAKHYLTDLLLAEKQHALSPEKIIQASAEHYGIAAEDILSTAQTRSCAVPRQIAMYLIRQHLKLPFDHIGEIFDRDHSTVISSVKRIQKACDALDSEWANAINAIEKKFGK